MAWSSRREINTFHKTYVRISSTGLYSNKWRESSSKQKTRHKNMRKGILIFSPHHHHSIHRLSLCSASTSLLSVIEDDSSNFTYFTSLWIHHIFFHIIYKFLFQTHSETHQYSRRGVLFEQLRLLQAPVASCVRKLTLRVFTKKKKKKQTLRVVSCLVKYTSCFSR